MPAYPENLGAWGVVGAGEGADNDGGGGWRVERQGVAAVGGREPPGYGEMWSPDNGPTVGALAGAGS